jgi:hypothetical protein
VNTGSFREIVAALKAKFGEPVQSSAKSAKWKNSVGSLNVSESYVRAADGTYAGSCDITSVLNDRGGGKDI